MPGHRPLALGLLGIAVLFSACKDRRGLVEPPPEARLFDRYVALGNSITAGFESQGINDSTQAHAYPVLLARRVDATFNVAELRQPGCPPPLVGPAPLTSQRVGGAGPTACAGLASPIARPVQSLAFPGFRIADALTVPGGLTGLLYVQAFGNRSLVQAMLEANPTLVSVWLGNNDALSAALYGDLAQLTPLANFTASLSQIVSAIAGSATVQDAILVGVADPLHAPLVQPGAYFWAASQDPALAPLLPKPVRDDCAPLTPAGDPNPLAANLLSFLAFTDPAVAEVSCADAAPYLLSAAEQAAIAQRVEEFNAAIRQSAESHQWIYVDANQEIIGPQLAEPDRIRNCQGLATATTPESFRLAVEQTCPHPGAPNFFGSAVSFDGVHPSLEGQEIIVAVLRAALVQKHGPDL